MRYGVPFLLVLAACGSGGGGGGSNDGDQQGGSVPTYNRDIQPILEVKCGPCHTTAAAGGSNHASSYEDTQKASIACDGARVYECILQRVQDGSMPEDGDCTGDPAADADNARCLTAAEQQLLEAWVAAGAPEGGAPDDGPAPDPYPDDPGGW